MENFPKIFKIRQKIDAPRVENIERRVNELLDHFEIQRKVKRGERIALTAGSRGIKDKPRVLRTIVERLKDLGASPYLVPCMGSHGGATAEGQVEILETLGITEKSMGAPILSSIEVQKDRHNQIRNSCPDRQEYFEGGQDHRRQPDQTPHRFQGTH